MSSNEREPKAGSEGGSASPHNDPAHLRPNVNCHGELDLTAAPCTAVGGGGVSDVRVVVVGDGPVRCVQSNVIANAPGTGATDAEFLPTGVLHDHFSGHAEHLPALQPSFPLPAEMVGMPAMPGSSAPKGAAGLRELQRIHRLLRGRYVWAIVLSLILGSGGGYAGFRLGSKTYRSTGAIRIMPVVPKVMYAVDEKGSIPMYETYVDAQLAMLKSQRVTENAMDDPTWQQLRKDEGKTSEAIERFSQGMEITRQGELIWVRAVNVDPQVAMAAVNATIQAYLDIYNELEATSGDKRSELREKLQNRLRSEWTSLQDRIQELAKNYGTADLKAQFDYKREQRNRLETLLRDIELTIEEQGKSGATPTTGPTVVGPEDVAFRYHDGRMMALMDRESQCKEELEALKRRGYGPDMLAVKESLARLATARQQIEEYVKTFRKYLDDHSGVTNVNDPRELELRRQALKVLWDDVNKDMLALGRDELKIAELTAQAADVKLKLDAATQAIEQVRLESQMMGRVVWQQHADKPLAAFKDTRAGMATAGGMGGVVIGFGLMLLLGLLNGSMQHPDDADAQLGALTMLGVVPRVTTDLADPEHAALTAHSVHEIRTRLQILLGAQSNARQTFGITSPTAGAGKTSLTLALGLSFAAANQRTLLIDCDIVGGGLTRTVDAIARRRLGAILLRERLITPRQLQEGLRVSSRSHQRLGKVLAQLGYITSEAVNNAMILQQNDAIGLLDALEGEDILSCVAETGIEGLFIMPLGDANVHDAASLSPAAFRDLLDRATRNFDAVIVDTGPILGSLEVSIVASQMDAMVLAVAKGDTKAVVKKAMSQLNAVGTRIAGMVFNRASDHDMISFGSYRSSSRGMRSGSDGSTVEQREAPEADRFGPVARAVASWSPPMGAGSKRARARETEPSAPSTTSN